MKGAESYLSGAMAALEKVRANLPQIKAAAKLLSDTIQAGNAIFSFGATHSFIMTEELVYRSGGLMLVNPIISHGMNLTVRPMTMTSQLERLPELGRIYLEHSPLKAGDAIILTSTSGRNTVMIDMALAARERGAKIIVLTSKEYSAKVTSRHPSGKKLGDLADVLLDNGAGGTGTAFDWALLKGFDRPYFLAGGLGPGNVRQAIMALVPFAVDVSSGIETNGAKDYMKMTAFVNAARHEE